MKAIKSLIVVAGLLAATSVSANVITLDFEGVGDLASIGNFYNGGAGTNYGVSISPATLAVVDADAGGNGNFANEPSANTIMFFLDANNAILNIASGFDTGFSFFYTSSTAASVKVYDGLNGAGNLLGTLALDAQFNKGCTGDPSGQFCNWSAVGVAFNGIAKSIDFGGTANFTGFDDITFGSVTPGVSQVPVPAAAWLFGTALLGFAGLSRRRSL